MIGVKICGVRGGAALAAAVDGGADWVGFVLEPRSPRGITPNEAAALASILPAPVRPVLLMVAPDDCAVDAALAAVPRAALQLYVDETRVAELGSRHADAELWRAVPLSPGQEPPSTTAARRLVVEAAPPLGPGALPGGHGGRLDWARLASWRAPVPWLLAGGLNPENVGAAVRSSGATAVDVSSGVEVRRGEKDPGLIRSFIAASRAEASPDCGDGRQGS